MSDDQLDLQINAQQRARDEWCDKIKAYEKSFERWTKRCEGIIDRFRDEHATNEVGNRAKRYNLFWANVQTLGPAVCSKPPKMQVSRRYFDKDPIGRLASAVLERATQYEMDIEEFDFAMLASRDDYLITGRGTLWQRYEPIIEKAAQDEEDNADDNTDEPGQVVNNDPQPGVEAIGANGGPKMDQVIGENAPTDYVHWKDFLHGPAQNWKQVPWVGRRVLMDKASVQQRWPVETLGYDVSALLSFTHKQELDDDKNKATQSRGKGNLALIYECWDKTKFKVCWYSPDLKDRLIEEVEDPLLLNDFFPCPQPLYATMTTDRLIPIPDYYLYQDQARTIDNLTARIDLLQKALAVRGLYDKSNGNLADLLNERPENFMLPVDNWAAFAEKGGLQGTTSFVPIDIVAKVLTGLMEQRTAQIQDVYNITGIADIIRGVSDPDDTAKAQTIKGQFANLRLNTRRDAMAKFLRSALSIKSEVICQHFDQSTIRQISGFDMMTEVTEAVKKGIDVNQLWQEVYQLLSDDPLRLTRLDVETDSMVQGDQQAEQASRTEFLSAVGGYLAQAVTVAKEAPQLVPLMGEMLSFGVRGFKIGRELESSIDSAIASLQQIASQPPPPNPTVAIAQARLATAETNQKTAEARGQAEVARANVDAGTSALNSKQEMYEFEENIKLQREELMLKYGVQPFIEAALSAFDTDATQGTGA